MIDPARVGCLLLAAGRSTRFGGTNKLCAMFRDKPLAEHAEGTLRTIPFARHVVVVSDATKGAFARPFECVTNPRPEAGLASSIILGLDALIEADIDACLIALADMPMVSREHFMELLAHFDIARGISLVASSGEGRAQVPALIGKGHFPALKVLKGDEGARELLRGALKIPCEPAMLADFDEPQDFERHASGFSQCGNLPRRD